MTDLGTKGFADRLVPQADAQRRNLATALDERAGQIDTDAGICRVAWTWADDDTIGVRLDNIVDAQRIVSHHAYIGIDRPQQLIQVEGEAVSAVYQEDHRIPSFSATSALTTAAALLMHSWFSLAGSLSATMPAPLRTKTRPFFLKASRIAMQVSMLPARST